MNIFLDTNIIIDIFVIERRQSFPQSMDAVTAAIKRNCNCYVSASTITDIYYILRKAMRSSERAIKAVKQLLRIVAVADVNAQDIEEALKTDIPDFEDGVADSAACRHGCTYILTRNTADFINSRVPSLTPGEFMDLMYNQIKNE